MSYKGERTTSRDNFYGTWIPLLLRIASLPPERYQTVVEQVGEGRATDLVEGLLLDGD